MSIIAFGLLTLPSQESRTSPEQTMQRYQQQTLITMETNNGVVVVVLIIQNVPGRSAITSTTAGNFIESDSNGTSNPFV